MRFPGLGNKATAGNGAPRLWPYAAVLMLAAACAIAVLAWSADSSASRRQQDIQAALAEREARLLLARLEQQLQGAVAAQRVLAAQERLVRAFEQSDRDRLAGLQQEYRGVLPGALRLVLLPAGYTDVDLAATPPLGYALLDMMRSAEKQQQAPPAEVHLPGQAGAHVNLLQPVLGASGVIGHVVLSYPLSWLQQPLGGARGGVALVQGGVTVLAIGAAQGLEHNLPVPGTAWHLVYRTPPVSASVAGFDLAVPLLLATVLLLLIAGVFYRLQRTLRGTAAGTAAAMPSRPVRQPIAPAQTAVPLRTAPPPRPDSGIGVRTVPADKLPARRAAPAAAEPPAPPDTAGPRTSEPVGGVAVEPTILRAYDVRGIVGQGLTANVVHALGRAIATEAAAAGQQEVVVARDGRLSSPELAGALIDGLVAGGRQVIDVGQVPTPVMHFATFHLRTGAGVMVTGSHNPRDYNGLKIVIGGRTWSGDAIKGLGQRVERGDFISGDGGVRSVDVLADYVDRVAQDVRLHRPLRIVVDCGNGVAGAVAPQVFRAMGCEVEELFCEVDGYFPNHHPDPAVPSNLDALISLVRLQDADLGLAFDGDGDRLGVVDARGRIIWPDRQLMLFARDVLARVPGGHVVFDVKCSAKLAAVVADSGGVPVMWKSGHSMIRNKMREVDAPLAGDMSGHLFFKDRWFGFDDAVYAGARLLEILSAAERDSDAMFAELPDTLSTPEIRIDLAEGEAERIMAALGEEFGRSFANARVTTIDGIRVDTADGWGLVRASNTQPCLVLRFEADDIPAMGRLQEAFRSRLLAIKPTLDLPF